MRSGTMDAEMKLASFCTGRSLLLLTASCYEDTRLNTCLGTQKEYRWLNIRITDASIALSGGWKHSSTLR